MTVTDQHGKGAAHEGTEDETRAVFAGMSSAELADLGIAFGMDRASHRRSLAFCDKRMRWIADEIERRGGLVAIPDRFEHWLELETPELLTFVSFLASAEGERECARMSVDRIELLEKIQAAVSVVFPVIDPARFRPTDTWQPFVTSRTVPDLWPEYMRTGVAAWLLRGERQGGYLMALFEGRLFDAACNADGGNFRALAGCAKWIAQCCPRDCHGSPERCAEWEKKGGLEGEPISSREGR